MVSNFFDWVIAMIFATFVAYLLASPFLAAMYILEAFR